MKSLLIACALIWPFVSVAEDLVAVTLAWQEPVTRSDDSPLTPGEIQGYDLMYNGFVIFNVWPSGTTQSDPPFYFPAGSTHTMALRTVDTEGRISEWTPNVTVNVNNPPSAPSITCQ